MSSNLSVFNQQSLASAASIRSMMAEKSQVLKNELPKEDINIEIGVVRETDLNMIHEVAMIHFDYTTEKLKLNFTVYKEEDVRQHRAEDSEGQQLLQDFSTPTASQDTRFGWYQDEISSPYYRSTTYER